MSALRSALLALLTALPAIAAHATEPPTAQAADIAETATVYWQQHREGWFWYRDPPPPTARPAQKAPATPARPRELADFEAMQQRLETLKRVAVMNPTDDNLMAYMRFQRMVMDRSQVFADRWQRLVWREPSLDYASEGRPTNTLAIAAFDERLRERDTAAVRQLAASHGLVFVFRSDCPFCHRFAPVLKRFAQSHGLTVLAISLDG
ncbi:MAG: conjugal transfer protein TraF, partial [Rubrivivax sp.]|nr:conjugal transfer protein TraF [Rubrivivax sp.]